MVLEKLKDSKQIIKIFCNHLTFLGPPQIISEVVEVFGVMGQEVKIEAEFCSDPGPIRNTWNWEDIVLPSGNQYEGTEEICKLDVDMDTVMYFAGKFTAEMDKMTGKGDCYKSSLIITNLASDDMRSYKLMAENIHGTDSVDVKLIIQGR